MLWCLHGQPRCPGGEAARRAWSCVRRVLGCARRSLYKCRCQGTSDSRGKACAELRHCPAAASHLGFRALVHSEPTWGPRRTCEQMGTSGVETRSDQMLVAATLYCCQDSDRRAATHVTTTARDGQAPAPEKGSSGDGRPKCKSAWRSCLKNAQLPWPRRIRAQSTRPQAQ